MPPSSPLMGRRSEPPRRHSACEHSLLYRYSRFPRPPRSGRLGSDTCGESGGYVVFKNKDSVVPGNRRWSPRGGGKGTKGKHTYKQQTWVRPALDTPANVYFKVFLKRRSVTRDFDDTPPPSLPPPRREVLHKATHHTHTSTHCMFSPPLVMNKGHYEDTRSLG